MKRKILQPTIKVYLQRAAQSKNIPSKLCFKGWIKKVLKYTKTNYKEIEICIRIVSEKESAFLNKTYRNKIGSTNVLSFDYDNDENSIMMGDLAICAGVVEWQAERQHKTVRAHYAHMFVHGCLHLFGYEHKTKKQEKLMENLEIKILKDLCYRNPYE